MGGLEPADDCLGLEPTVGITVVGVVLSDLAGWPASEDDVEKACRKMTMRPSEWAEKIASTTTSSSTIAAMRWRGGRWPIGEAAALLCVADVRETCCWDAELLRGAVRPWRVACGGDSGSNRSLMQPDSDLSRKSEQGGKEIRTRSLGRAGTGGTCQNQSRRRWAARARSRPSP